jgi:hypothetical protein
MFISYKLPLPKYNIKYANKVNRIYSSITDKLTCDGIYGTKRVIIRHKEIRNALSIGVITREELENWKLSQKVV